MQTALYITDCSIDSALALKSWLAASTDRPIRLTVVRPYDVAPGEPLNKATLAEARQAASAQLKNWKAIVGDMPHGTLATEILFSDPDLALRIHLLIRRYNVVLTDGQWLLAPEALTELLTQTGTQLHYLGNVPEYAMGEPVFAGQ